MDAITNTDWPYTRRPYRYNGIIGSTETVTGAEPLTLTEVKRNLLMLFDEGSSYSFADDDLRLTELISECREQIERVTGLDLVAKSRDVILRNDLGGVQLPGGPILTITNLYDKAGTVLLASQYELLGYGYRTLTYPVSDHVRVVYTSGYTPATIPVGLKLALKQMIAYCYQNRGSEVDFEGTAFKYAGKYVIQSSLV